MKEKYITISIDECIDKIHDLKVNESFDIYRKDDGIYWGYKVKRIDEADTYSILVIMYGGSHGFILSAPDDDFDLSEQFKENWSLDVIYIVEK